VLRAEHAVAVEVDVLHVQGIPRGRRQGNRAGLTGLPGIETALVDRATDVDAHRLEINVTHFRAKVSPGRMPVRLAKTSIERK
jgi:hypothetical protein